MPGRVSNEHAMPRPELMSADAGHRFSGRGRSLDLTSTPVAQMAHFDGQGRSCRGYRIERVGLALAQSRLFDGVGA